MYNKLKLMTQKFFKKNLKFTYSFRSFKLVLKSWGGHFHFIRKCIKNGVNYLKII